MRGARQSLDDRIGEVSRRNTKLKGPPEDIGQSAKIEKMFSKVARFSERLKLLDACCHIGVTDTPEHQVPEGPMLVIARSG
jgi:hypothetical protein